MSLSRANIYKKINTSIIILHYEILETYVNVCFVDYEKAFDKVDCYERSNGRGGGGSKGGRKTDESTMICRQPGNDSSQSVGSTEDKGPTKQDIGRIRHENEHQDHENKQWKGKNSKDQNRWKRIETSWKILLPRNYDHK